MTAHTYAFTYESCRGDDVVGSAEVQVKYTFKPGRPMLTYLRNGDPGYPEEAPEIEITDILVEGYSSKEQRVPQWRPATAEEFDTYKNYATMEYEDDMVAQAEGDELAAAEDAAEHAAEVRADLARLDEKP